MTTGLSDGIASDLGQRIQPTYGYYRQKNGWITISPITQLEVINYAKRGWTHLSKYGAFDMSPYVVNHPFEALFMFGGAMEMPAQQVLETGLYIDPPLVPTCRRHMTQYHRRHTSECWQGAQPVAFPQMGTLDPKVIGPFVCEFCQRKLPTKEARHQHQSVVHTEELGNLETGRSLGKSLGEVFNGRVDQARVDQPELKNDTAELREKVASLEKRLALVASPAKQTRRRKAAKVNEAAKVNP